MAERKLVVVNDSGILHELGGIGGPICTPTRIPIEIILKMVNNRRHVYECNPIDPRNEALRVRLTQANYKSDNFGEPSDDYKKDDPEQDPAKTPEDTNDEPENPGTTDDPEQDPVDPQNGKNPETDTDVPEDPTDKDPEDHTNDEPENPGTTDDPEHDPVDPQNGKNPETDTDVPEDYVETQSAENGKAGTKGSTKSSKKASNSKKNK